MNDDEKTPNEKLTEYLDLYLASYNRIIMVMN